MKKHLYQPLVSLAILGILLLLGGCGRDDNPADPGGPDPSPDWRLVESGITNTVRGLAANDTMMVAVGDGGIIYTSTDGHNWTVRRENGHNDALTDVVWAGDLFIAVGWDATLMSSPDGITWTLIGVDPHSHLYAVAASDTLLIAVGSSSNVYSSRDGVEWFPLNTGITDGVVDVIYANGLWLIGAGAGNCYWSDDAVTWTPQITGDHVQVSYPALAASDTLFYALSFFGPGPAIPDQVYQVRYSSNGSNWFHLGNLDAWNIWDICWTGSELVAVGEGTNYHLGMPDGLIFSSTGGLDFVEHTTEAPFSLAAAETFNGELLVGGGGGYILGGPQADDLSVRTSGAGITGVVWNGTEYIAVTAHGTIMRSADGEDWTETHSRVSTWFERLAYSGSMYVTFGGLGVPLDIYSSSDGDDWIRTQMFDDIVLSDVIWGGGNFLVCGRKGAVYLSGDGENWVRHFVGDSVALHSVCYDGQRYLAAATHIVYTSDNGIDWTKPTIDPTDTKPIIDRLIWSGTEYVAIGYDHDSTTQWVCESPDAVHWTTHEIDSPYELNDIAWTGSRYIICGRSGTLLTSTDAHNWEVVASGTEQSLVDIAIGGGKAVVVGGNRTVLVSP